jgi:ATP-dependent helicase/DNAse subunit B
MSPSSIERWCGCPFQYYLERVLYIDKTHQPEADEAWTILPNVRGSLVHEILRRFFTELGEARRPRPNEGYTSADHARIDAIAHEEFVSIEARGESGYALAWENERSAIVRDLHSVLRRDDEIRSEGGWIPLWFEQSFGDERGWPAAALAVPGGEAVRLRGRIDRIDVAPDRDRPERARVLDYKTGRVEAKAIASDPLVAGTQLQLAVYAQAVRDRLSALGADRPEVEAAYWQIASRWGFALTPVPLTGQVEERLRLVLGTVNSAVRAGSFPQVPGEETQRPGLFGWENCLWCDYDRICPAARDQLATRKAADPAAAVHGRLESPLPT